MTDVNFDPLATKYSGKNAYLLGKAAQLAYKPKEVVENTLKNDWKMPNCRFIDINETQCFVAGDDEKIIISFRGTEPSKMQDVMSDVNLKFTVHPLGKVHCGFLKAINFAWDDTIKTIQEFQTKGQTIWFTGHSLGAALATLGVAKMIDLNKPVHGLYTFGQPRTGDSNFAKNFDLKYKSCSFRFVHNNDIVTRVAPSAFGYKHMGTFLYIDALNILHFDIRWWNEFKDRVKASIEDLGKPGIDGIKDHDMGLYLKGIEKNIDKKPIA
ncbi:lipase family protein [Aphanothece sacrum]|uniref:Lipase n=1 Tax=Aphanothece sacrum FPU1 TaxID=1920663 RepID=A0A401IE11_APHSA|nr:lipase family protein [Aphanothece sacrum]GBF79476.1 lipase [Aphanothece sacrum FPU1]GBF85824.1 lipase [Aphanothece sacrum FPU3]